MNKKNMFFKIIEFYKPFRKIMVIMISLLALEEILVVFSTIVYGKIIDSIINKQTLEYTLWLVGASFLINVVITIAGHFFERINIKKFDYESYRHLKNQTLKKIFNFSIGQNISQHSGAKQSIINRGESDLSNMVYNFAYDIFPTIAQVLFVMVALFFMAPLIGFLVLGSGAIYLGASLFMNRVVKKDIDELKDKETEIGKFYSEILRNIELVQINAQEKRFSGEYNAVAEKTYTFGKKVWIRFINLLFSRSVISATTRIIILMTGVYMVYKGNYTPGSLVIIFTWTSNIFNQFNRLGHIHRRITDMLSSTRKYFELVDTEPEIKIKEDAKKPEKICGKIEFKNVSFKYPARKFMDEKGEEQKADEEEQKEKEDTVANLNFTIEPGQKVAFVGHSGAGKSTLVYLITRAYDATEGSVLVDGIDLRDLDLHYYRQHIGLVEQSVMLFDNTLRYNMTLGVDQEKEKVSDERLDEIAKLSGVSKFFAKLEKGYDTIIGEKGIKLSGGERQRVGIARALIKDPSILIFDEATSSLDSENERLIKESIDHASQGRTTIIIAHRLSTVKDADKIIVFEGGQISGAGTHAELLKNCEPYKKLVKNQMVTV